MAEQQPKSRRAAFESQIFGGAEALKDGTIKAIANTRDAVKQHGHGMRDELKNIATNALSIPVSAVGVTLESLTKLITLQPLEATRTAMKGMIGAIGHTRNAALGLVPVATRVVGGGLSMGAGAVSKVAKTGGGLISKTVKLPVTAPLAAITAVSGGLKRFGDWAAKIDPLKPSEKSDNQSAAPTLSSAPKDNKHKASEALGIPTSSTPVAENDNALEPTENEIPEPPNVPAPLPKDTAPVAPVTAANAQTNAGSPEVLAKAA